MCRWFLFDSKIDRSRHHAHVLSLLGRQGVLGCQSIPFFWYPFCIFSFVMKIKANRPRTWKEIIFSAFALSALVCLSYLAKKDLLMPGSDFAGNNYYFNASFYGALAVSGAYFFRGEGVTAGEWFKDLAGGIGLIVLLVLSLPLYLMGIHVAFSPLFLLGNLLSGNIDYLFLFYYLLIAMFFVFLLTRKSGK